MTAQCTIHGQVMTERFSKTKVDEAGNPKGYFAHGFGTDMCFGENTRKGQVRQASAQPAPMPPARDFDSENRGKVRSLFVEALISFKGVEISRDELIKITKLTEYAMTGIIPLPDYEEYESEERFADR